MYERIILEIVLRNDSKMFELAKENSKFKNFVYAYELSDFDVKDESEMRTLCEMCVENGIYYFAIVDINKAWIDQAHKQGLQIMVYTYNDPLKIYELYDRGVDYVFTDFTMLI